jgi:hypothetical protein
VRLNLLRVVPAFCRIVLLIAVVNVPAFAALTVEFNIYEGEAYRGLNVQGTGTPGTPLAVTESWPDGSVREYPMTVNAQGTYWNSPDTARFLGTYRATVRDLNTGETATASYANPGDFSATVTAPTRIVEPLHSVEFYVIMTTTGFGGTIVPTVLNASQMPGATVRFAYPEVSVPKDKSGIAFVTISTSLDTPPGTYNLIVQGTSGSVTRAVPVTIIVRDPFEGFEAYVGLYSSSQVEFRGFGTPGATVTLNQIWPDGSPHGPYTTTVNANGHFFLYPFELEQLGNYWATLQESGSGRTISLTYFRQGDFSARVDSTSKTVIRGRSASYTVTFGSIYNFEGVVTPAALNWSQIPGAIVSWSPSQVTVPNSESVTATITIQTSLSTPPGTYNNITLQGKNGSVIHATFPVSLTVTSGPLARDFDGDGMSDLLLRHTSGPVLEWQLNGAAIKNQAFVGAVPADWAITTAGDFNGDGKSDILLRHSSGIVYAWMLNGTTIIDQGFIAPVTPDWTFADVGDFNDDGKADVLWRHSTGVVLQWLLNGTTIAAHGSPLQLPVDVVGVGDFDGDGKSDILSVDTNNLYEWLLNGTSLKTMLSLGALTPGSVVAGIGDFNGDGKSDLLIRENSGVVAVWLLNGGSVISRGTVGNISAEWSLVRVSDFNGDGKFDVLWRHSSGGLYEWLMNGLVATGHGLPAASLEWKIQ